MQAGDEGTAPANGACGGRRRGRAEKLLVPARLFVLVCRLGHESVLDDYEPALMILLGGAFSRFRLGLDCSKGETSLPRTHLLRFYSPLMRWHTNVNVYEMRRLDISTFGRGMLQELLRRFGRDIGHPLIGWVMAS